MSIELGSISAKQVSEVGFLLNLRHDAYGTGVHSVSIMYPDGESVGGNFRSDRGFAEKVPRWVRRLVYRACCELLEIAARGEEPGTQTLSFLPEEPSEVIPTPMPPLGAGVQHTECSVCKSLTDVPHPYMTCELVLTAKRN